MSRYARDLDLRELNAHTQGILLTPPGSDVLDVGTADGHPVVEGLKARGCRVWGVEIDADAAAVAAPLCEQMVVGNVEELDLAAAFGDRRFDVVLCLDVLEHLVEPLPVLRRLAGLLTPTGQLVASIPNVTHAAVRLQLLDGSFTYTDTGLLDRTHVRFFDRAEVDALFSGAGMTVIERLEVRREPHETEIPLDLSAVPAETLEAVRKDPDARVFQWVVVARGEVAVEGETTGLATALLAQVTQMEQAVRESAEHVGWVEGHLSEGGARSVEQEQRITDLAARVNELDGTLRARMGELFASDAELRAVRADLAVKDAYVAQLQASLGVDAPAPVPVPVAAMPDHPVVVRVVQRLQRYPATYRIVRRVGRAALRR